MCIRLLLMLNYNLYKSFKIHMVYSHWYIKCNEHNGFFVDLLRKILIESTIGFLFFSLTHKRAHTILIDVIQEIKKSSRSSFLWFCCQPIIGWIISIKSYFTCQISILFMILSKKSNLVVWFFFVTKFFLTDFTFMYVGYFRKRQSITFSTVKIINIPYKYSFMTVSNKYRGNKNQFGEKNEKKIHVCTQN